ncbi:MAG: diguanylate cyclase [Persephonella sp.]|nr:diguanylate cyclase [Persephonella sp.]
MYSNYGIYILQNKTYQKSIRDFIRQGFPCVDINLSVEDILDFYAKYYDDYDYLIITEDDKYVGVLDAKRLLKVIRQKEVLIAQNLNPLTKLAGNVLINRFIDETDNLDCATYFMYFDFDNFKPFNDKYGFRRGDRAILLFADILRKNFNYKNQIIGHIGGDDFFVGVRDVSLREILSKFYYVIDSFNQSVKDLYNLEDKEKGYIIAKDRYNTVRKFGLLSVSGFLLEIPEKKEIDREALDEVITVLKKEAKSNKISMASYL